MTNVLTALGATAGLALFLIMAVVPFLADLPERGRRPRPAQRGSRPLPVPVLGGPVDAGRHPASGRQPVGPRA